MSMQCTSRTHAARRLVGRVARLLPAVCISVVWGGTAVAQNAPSAASVSPSGAALAASTYNMPDHYRALVDKYCVSCHNGTNSIPAGQPLYLDDANYDDVARDNDIWEKVVTKIDIGQMPPKDKAHPGAAELQGFRNWLVGALDKGWQERGTPGEYTITGSIARSTRIQCVTSSALSSMHRGICLRITRTMASTI